MTEWHIGPKPTHYHVSYHAFSVHLDVSVVASYSDHPKIGDVYSFELFSDDYDHDDIGQPLHYEQSEQLLVAFKCFVGETNTGERRRHSLYEDLCDEALEGLVSQLASDAAKAHDQEYERQRKEVGPTTRIVDTSGQVVNEINET